IPLRRFKKNERVRFATMSMLARMGDMRRTLQMIRSLFRAPTVASISTRFRLTRKEGGTIFWGQEIPIEKFRVSCNVVLRRSESENEAIPFFSPENNASRGSGGGRGSGCLGTIRSFCCTVVWGTGQNHLHDD